MPLFKFNPDTIRFPVVLVGGELENTTPEMTGDLVVPFLSIVGQMGANGSLAFPLPTIAGRMMASVSGTLSAILPGIDGFVHVAVFIDGEVGIPSPAISGNMQVEGLFGVPFPSVGGYFAADGQMAMPLPHVAGSFAGSVSGSIALACPVAAGLISVPVFVDGAISVPLLVSEGHMQAEGTLSVSIPAVKGYMQIEGSLSVSIPTVKGYMQAEGSLSVSIPAVKGYMQAEGTVAASIPSVCGIVTSPHFIFGETIIPIPQLGGDVRLVETIAGSVASFAPVTFGSINLHVPMAVTGRLVTPAPSIAGTLYAEQILNIGDDLIVNYQDDARYI